MPKDAVAEGSWGEADPTAAAKILASSRASWWIAGGWALDLFRGTPSRSHLDPDVGVLRRDLRFVLHSLSTWEVFWARDGRLIRFVDECVPPLDVHSLWCRPTSAAPWAIELMLEEADDETWVYRRDPRIRRPLSTLSRHNSDGIPYLAPEIQLLYKSKAPRDCDEQDFSQIYPLLAEDARRWLQNALELVRPDHPWISILNKPQQV